METKLKDKKKSDTSKINQYRKFLNTPEDLEMVKEMIADGLKPDQILHALGYVNGAPDQSAFPNDHSLSSMKADNQDVGGENESAEALDGQGDGQTENQDEGSSDELLTHITGLLNHIAKKPKTSEKKSTAKQ